MTPEILSSMAEEPWSGEKELKKEFKDILAKKPPISASIVGNITKIALKHDKCYKQVVLQIERFISKVAPEYRLSGLYLLDSIVKNATKRWGPENPYRLRFSQNITTTVDRCFDCVPKDKDKVQKVLRIWLSEGIFPETVGQRIEKVINERIGHSRASEPPPSPPRAGSPPPLIAHRDMAPIPDPQPVLPQSDLTQFSSLSGLLGFPPNQLGVLGNGQWSSPTLHQETHPNQAGKQINYYSDEESSDDAARLNKLQQRREQEETKRLAEEERNQAAGGDTFMADGFSQLVNLHSLLQNLAPEGPRTNQTGQPNNMQHNNTVVVNNPTQPTNNNNQFQNQQNQQNQQPKPTGPYVRQVDPSQQLPRPQLRRGIPPGGEYGGDLPNGTVRVFTKTLFVGNLAPNVTEKMLHTVFSQCGPLQSLKYKAEKHYAFITYETRRDAEHAKNTVHKEEMEGRPMKVGWGRGWVQNTTEEEFDYEQGLSFIPREILGINEHDYPITLIDPQDLLPKPQPIQQPEGRQHHNQQHQQHHGLGGHPPRHELNRSNDRPPPQQQQYHGHGQQHHGQQGHPGHGQGQNQGQGRGSAQHDLNRSADRPPQQDRQADRQPQHDNRPQQERPQHDLNRSTDRPPQQDRPQHHPFQGQPQHNNRPQHDRPPHDRPPHDRPHDRPLHDRFPGNREHFEDFDRRPEWSLRGPPQRWDHPGDFGRGPPPRREDNFDRGDRRDEWRRDDRTPRGDRRDDRRDDRHDTRRKRSRSGSPDRRNSPSRKKQRRSPSPRRHLSHSQDSYY